MRTKKSYLFRKAFNASIITEAHLRLPELQERFLNRLNNPKNKAFHHSDYNHIRDVHITYKKNEEFTIDVTTTFKTGIYLKMKVDEASAIVYNYPHHLNNILSDDIGIVYFLMRLFYNKYHEAPLHLYGPYPYSLS